MTAKSDFKKVVRKRMTETGESYTEARQALAEQTATKINALLTEFTTLSGDRIDREHLAIEAANLVSNSDVSCFDGETLRRVFWLCRKEMRLGMLDAFMSQSGLSVEDQAWALEHRLIAMAMTREAHTFEDFVLQHEAFFEWVRQNLDAASQARAFCNPTVWGWWNEAGRGNEMVARMQACLDALPVVQENRIDRLRLTRDLLLGAAHRGDTAEADRLHATMRLIIDEPGEMPGSMGDDGRTEWEGIWRQTPLVIAGSDTERATEAALGCAEWISSQNGVVDWLLGEIAALCMFQGHYELSERLAEQALVAGQGKVNELIYVWRAGGHLGATGDVVSTVPLLIEARRHVSKAEMARFLDQQPPFDGYKDDKRLREILSAPGAG